MQYWSETVDDELNALGAFDVETEHVLGLHLDNDRRHVDVVLAADVPQHVVARVEALRDELASERLTIGTRRSRHTLAELEAGLRHIERGPWRQDVQAPAGPMSFGYSPALDRIEVHVPTACAAVGRKLTADLPGLVHVELDDGMGRG